MKNNEEKAYIAKVEIEYIIVAENEKEAKKLAAEALKNDNVYPEDFAIGRFSYVPAIYESMTDLVEARREITVKEASEMPGGYNEHK